MERPNPRRMMRPEPWLAAVALFLALCAADSLRAPQDQITVRLYLGAVDVYHQQIHPWTSRFIRCRYNPTCSRYSELAVQRFGIAKGLALTTKRLISCNGSVPEGTYDPVPER